MPDLACSNETIDHRIAPFAQIEAVPEDHVAERIGEAGTNGTMGMSVPLRRRHDTPALYGFTHGPDVDRSALADGRHHRSSVAADPPWGCSNGRPQAAASASRSVPVIRGLAALALVLAPATAAAATTPASGVVATYGDKARDRASIRAMAGTFKVTFDMRETVPFVAGYVPLKPKVSGGHEVVRVVIDEAERIGLQHLLVVEGEGGKPIVVKHWRQDWAWQPRTLLAYAGRGRWTLRPVPADDARGAWSQTVWQTDDSPRYGGLGRWRYDGGVARWASAETRRPLARRDATLKPPYDHYVGTNRHALTPSGWVHEQDNAKIGTKDGAERIVVHEVLVNSYVPAADFPVAAADAYWAATSAYWATVRAEWDRAIAASAGLRLEEEADNGSVTGHELMLIADDVASGEMTPAEAATEATALIRRETGR